MKTIEAYKLFRLSNIFGPNKTDIEKAINVLFGITKCARKKIRFIN